jgi:hypothetical protein
LIIRAVYLKSNDNFSRNGASGGFLNEPCLHLLKIEAFISRTFFASSVVMAFSQAGYRYLFVFYLLLKPGKMDLRVTRKQGFFYFTGHKTPVFLRKKAEKPSGSISFYGSLIRIFVQK